jgi:hypothetical protein
MFNKRTTGNPERHIAMLQRKLAGMNRLARRAHIWTQATGDPTLERDIVGKLLECQAEIDSVRAAGAVKLPIQ